MAVIGTNILKAVDILNQGDLVGVPTETVYGLAGNALNVSAVARIFEVKQRPSFDPLIVHLPNLNHLESVVSEIPQTAMNLALELWPGPLTLVLPRNEVIPDLVTSGLDTVAVRVPNHPLVLELLGRLDFPLACPSANPFGYVSPTLAEHVNQQLGEDILYILDGGACSIGIESTIVGFDGEQPIIYRPGGIDIDRIKEIAGNVIVKTKSSRPITPGMLDSHYSPGKTLLLGDISNFIQTIDVRNVGILSFRDTFPGVPDSRQIQLTSDGDLSQAAKNLFASLRKLDAMDIRYIFAEPVPNHGLGIAINDRLARASTKSITLP